MGKITAIHGTGHVHVGVEESDICVRLHVLKCALSMLGFEHLKTHRRQKVSSDETGEFVIVGKHGEGARS
jgi:hypothetical protein